MRKYRLILIVFLVFSLSLFPNNENEKIYYFEKMTGEFYDIFGNVDGGVRVILNSKSYVKEDFELYLKCTECHVNLWMKRTRQERDLSRYLIKIFLRNIIQIVISP